MYLTTEVAYRRNKIIIGGRVRSRRSNMYLRSNHSTDSQVMFEVQWVTK